jgi:hypothetical protein
MKNALTSQYRSELFCGYAAQKDFERAANLPGVGSIRF